MRSQLDSNCCTLSEFNWFVNKICFASFYKMKNVGKKRPFSHFFSLFKFRRLTFSRGNYWYLKLSWRFLWNSNSTVFQFQLATVTFVNVRLSRKRQILKGIPLHRLTWTVYWFAASCYEAITEVIIGITQQQCNKVTNTMKSIIITQCTHNADNPVQPIFAYPVSLNFQ